jgi:hypothetical protein
MTAYNQTSQKDIDHALVILHRLHAKLAQYRHPLLSETCDKLLEIITLLEEGDDGL